jgi:hypothetical protein
MLETNASIPLIFMIESKKQSDSRKQSGCFVSKKFALKIG